jgi:hypothetical protein
MTETSDYHMVAVGLPYEPGVVSYPEGGALFVFDGSPALRLLITLKDPTPAEIESIQAGPAKFSWADRPHMGIFGYRFGGRDFSWSAFLWNPHRFPEYAPLDPGGRHPLMAVTLVDAATGLVRALRLLTLSPRFAQAMHDTSERLAAAPFSQIGYERAEDALDRRYRTPNQLVRETAQLWCTGGSPGDSTSTSD